MKKILLFFSIALLAVQSAVAQDAGSILMGYCGEQPYTGMALGGARRESIVGVQFDEDFVNRFAGCRVTAIRVCLSGVVGSTAGVWITDELPDEIPYMTDPKDVTSDDFYKAAKHQPQNFAYHFPHEEWLDIYDASGQPDQSLAWQWQEKKLSKPYFIEEGVPFYAGFRSFPVPGGVESRVIALESGGAAGTDDHSYVYFPDSNDPWCPLAQTSMGQFSVGLMIQVRIEGEALPRNNVAMAAINGNEELPSNEPVTFECVMQNKGINKLMSFEMSYSIDGEVQATKRMQFTNGLDYNQYGGFKLEGITFTEAGPHTITVTARRPNDEEDTDPSDDTMTKNLFVYSSEALLERHVLVESFSTINCVNCPRAHKDEEEAFDGTDAVLVTHHAGFYTDELTIPGSEDLLWFYNMGGSTFAPAIMLDRANVNSFYATGYAGPVFLPGDAESLRNVMATLKKIPTTVDVKLSATYDPATRQLTVTATGDVLATPAGNDHRINVWLTESGVKAKRGQTGSELGRDYIHNNVLRLMLTNSSWGEKIDLTGSTYTRTYTATLDAGWNLANMEVVGFLANINGNDPTDCRVFNAGKLRLSSLEGIATPAVGTAASTTEYYSLSGQRLTAPTSGVTLIRTAAPDGTVKVLKRVGR